MSKGPVSQFIEHHYRHFNSAALMDAAKGYVTHLDEGGKMMITLAGAMSTAELGLSLAEMIRQDKVAIISCTGANLEEDIMNLVAHSHYKRVPNYRDLSPQEEWDLLENHYNRVTDTCIPEEEAFRRLQQHIHKIWKDADDKGERYFPHEYMYKMLLSGVLEQYYEIDPKNSWMLAAAKKNIPIVVPGWEDSTMGNIFASYIIKGQMKASTMKSGIEYMVWLSEWYRNNSGGKGVGFFQIGGGIAGDFPICVVPMMYQDLEWHDVPFWLRRRAARAAARPPSSRWSSIRCSWPTRIGRPGRQVPCGRLSGAHRRNPNWPKVRAAPFSPGLSVWGRGGSSDCLLRVALRGWRNT